MICRMHAFGFFLITFATAMVLAIPPSAADPVPGDACTVNNATMLSGGVEESGVGYFMVCQGGVWVRIFESDTTGKIELNEATVIGTSSITCDTNAEGAIRYNDTGNYLEFCNGSAWTPIASTAACDGTPSSFEFTDETNAAQSTLITSNILLIAGTDAACNVIVSVSGGDAPNFRICADSSCSSVLVDWTATNTAYDMNSRYLQLRDTSSATANSTINVVASVGGVDNTWSISTTSAGSCGASPTIGDTCADGSVYAGQSPDGNVDFYVARCDIGMSWGGSDCTGPRSSLDWNNNNTTGFVTTGYSSGNDGEVNTAGLAVQDSDSITAGTQDHVAAKACADLSVHGHSDWYLPARDELEVIYDNLQDGTPSDNNPDPLISGFTTGHYWTSTERGDDQANTVSFDNGYIYQYGYFKYNDYPVRCARKD